MDIRDATATDPRDRLIRRWAAAAVLASAMVFFAAGLGNQAPDVPVVESATAVDLTINNPDPNFDYLALALAEVPNRVLLPEALRYLDTPTVPLSFAKLTDAQYLAAAGVTDLFVNEFESFNFSFALQYTYDLADWASGLAFDGATDFLPLFDLENTYYDDSAATVHWALDGAADAVDAWLVAFFPANFGAELLVVPGGEASSYTPPAELFHAGPSESDAVLVAGLDLPDGVDVNSFDPTALLANNFAAINFWSNTSLLDLLGGILP
jgi:hypothetical protein